MISGWMRSFLWAASTTVVLAACGGSGDATEVAAQNPQLVSRGEATFAASCAACHGTDLRGTAQGPSLLSEVYVPGHHADISFLVAVQRGVPAHHWGFGDMPPIEGLTEEDVAAIIGFVRETQRIEGFEPYPP